MKHLCWHHFVQTLQMGWANYITDHFIFRTLVFILLVPGLSMKLHMTTL